MARNRSRTNRAPTRTAPNERRVRQRQAAGPSNKWKIIAVTSVISALIVIFVLYATFFQTTQPRKISKILRGMVEFGEALLIHAMQMDHVLQEDPFVDLVKTHVKPALEKVASIRSQTAMYEKMDRIPGGPTNFMATSLKDLDIIEEGLAQVEIEAMKINFVKMKQVERMVKEANQEFLGDNLKAEYDIENINALERHNIYVNPMIDPDDMDQLKFEIEFEELLDMFSRLAVLFEKLEESTRLFYDASDRYESKFSGSEDTEELFEETVSVSDNLSLLAGGVAIAQRDVDDEVGRNRRFYIFMLPHRMKTLYNIGAGQDQLMNYEKVKNAPYRKLVKMLANDIRITRERVLNLKYANPKKVEL